MAATGFWRRKGSSPRRHERRTPDAPDSGDCRIGNFSRLSFLSPRQPGPGAALLLGVGHALSMASQQILYRRELRFFLGAPFYLVRRHAGEYLRCGPDRRNRHRRGWESEAIEPFLAPAPKRQRPTLPLRVPGGNAAHAGLLPQPIRSMMQPLIGDLSL